MSPHRTDRTSAFTLIETMLVVAVIAIVVAGSTMGLGALGRSKLRSSALGIVGAARLAYNHSVTRGKTTRLAFDFENHTISVEEAEGDVTLTRQDDRHRPELEGAEAVDPWEVARQKLEQPLEPVVAQSPFQPLRNSEGVVQKKFQARPLGDGIRIVKLLTPHEREPREQGQGAVYFFKGGIAEHAVVQLSDSSDIVYSVEVHPLTGRGQVYAHAYEPPEPIDDEGSVVRDSL